MSLMIFLSLVIILTFFFFKLLSLFLFQIIFALEATSTSVLMVVLLEMIDNVQSIDFHGKEALDLFSCFQLG